MARLRVRRWWAFAKKRSDRRYRGLLRLFRIEHAFRKGVNPCYHAKKSAQFDAQLTCAIELARRRDAVPEAIDRARLGGARTRCGEVQNVSCATRQHRSVRGWFHETWNRGLTAPRAADPRTSGARRSTSF